MGFDLEVHGTLGRRNPYIPPKESSLSRASVGTLGSQGFRGIRGLGKTKNLTQSRIKRRLLLGLGLADADDPIAFLPFAALLEQLDALETLQDVSLLDKTTGGAKTWVLAHDKGIRISFEAFGTSLNLRQG